MLEVVEQQQCFAVAQLAELVDADRRGDRRSNELRLLHTREGDEEDSTGELADELGRCLERQPGLAGSTRAGERDESCRVVQ